MFSPTTFPPLRHLVPHPYVSKGTPHQYFVIPPSRAKSVEVGRSHTHLHQISAGVTVHRNRSCGRDVVRSDRVPEDGQRTRPFDVLQLSSFLWKILEEWGVLNIGGLPVPLIAVSYTHLRAHETDSYLVCRLLLEKKKTKNTHTLYHT